MAKSSIDPRLLERAEAAGLKLEITAGVPTWESFPGIRHQKAVERIAGRIKRPIHCKCECVHALDVDILFPDGSYKRPDVSIWCRMPDELDGAVTLVPEAVVESVEEREAGVASVSAPVHDAAGVVIAAVGISGPIERLTRSPGDRFGAQVTEAARAISGAIVASR